MDYRHEEEWKNIDTLFTAFDVSVNGTVTLLNGCATGTTALTRQGRKITMVRLDVDLVGTQLNASMQDTRFEIIYDKQPNGALPVQADILSANQSNAQWNPSNFPNRFLSLWRYQFQTTVNVEQDRPLPRSISLNLPVRFNTGTTAAITAITSGSLFLFAQTQNAGGGTESMQMSGSTRVWFIE